MKFHGILGIGAALALGLGLLAALSLLPVHVQAGLAAGINDRPPVPEPLLLAPNDIVAAYTLSISPTSTVVDAGKVFTVNIVISDVQDLGGLEYTLEFSPSVVLGARVQLGDFPGSTGRTVVELPPTGDPISNDTGTIEHGFLSFGGHGDGPSGAGIIASIAFTATGGGTSPLDLVEAQATDTIGPSVLTPTILIDGQVVVRQAGMLFLPLVARNFQSP
jgi:hypothetical protein